MLKLFNYDNVKGRVELNSPDILLIREFAALMNNERNKCAEDKKGEHKLRAFREFTYIYLAIDWNSPYSDYSEQERHSEAIKDSSLTEEEFNDETFRIACRKYEELQNSNRAVRVAKAAQSTVDKFIDYFNNIDPEERDALTGKPIFKVKDLLGEIGGLSDLLENLKSIEAQAKKDAYEQSQIRGGAEDGFDDYGD